MADQSVVPRWALLSAALAPIVLLASAAAARSVHKKAYDPVSQTLSTLAAHGQGQWIMTAGFVISAVCQIVTAVGLRVLSRLARAALAVAGCCGMAVAALPDQLGTATAHVVATGIAAMLLAVWPVLTISFAPSTPPARRARWAVAGSAVLMGLLAWVLYDYVSGVRLGLSERTAAVAEMLWPLVVVVSARRRLRRE